MVSRLRLEHVVGVDIAVGGSPVCAFGVAASTPVAVFRRVLPAMSRGSLTLLGVCAAIGLFASLAFQEIAHGVAATSNGASCRPGSID